MPSQLSVVVFAFASVFVLACKKPPSPPSSSTDAGIVALPSASAPSASADRSDGGVHIGMMGVREREAGAPPVDGGSAPPPLPLASEKLEIVAIGKTFNSKILWLSEHGNRVWLSALNLDAYADGDGPLTKGPDLLAKLPYKPGVHSMRVVGAYPHLFALRTKNVNGRMESPEPTLFVYAAEDGTPGTWKAAQPLTMSWYPHAFVAYRDGALIVNSEIQGNASPYYRPPVDGTTLTYLAPDGSLSDPKLGLHPHFMAWGASSDRTNLTLIGTFAIPPAKDKKDDDFGASGAHLVRITKDGTKKVAIQRSLGVAIEMYSARVYERDGKAIAVPPASLTLEEGWRPNGRTVFVVEDDKPSARTMSGNDSCVIVDAQLVGDAVYAIRRCYDAAQSGDQIVRLAPDGKTERLAMPLIVKDGGAFRVAKTDAERKTALSCNAVSLVVRSPGDLWASAVCGGTDEWRSPGVPIVLRRGRPQDPVIIP